MERLEVKNVDAFIIGCGAAGFEAAIMEPRHYPYATLAKISGTLGFEWPRPCALVRGPGAPDSCRFAVYASLISV